MKTVKEVLLKCEVGDELTNGNFHWVVTQKYMEENELLVIATPDEKNSDSFELWSSGVESIAHIPNLRKL